MVRAVCEAAKQGPEQLYEVMIKLSLMVEATAPTYGLSIWVSGTNPKPRLHWAEGLEESEIFEAEAVVERCFQTKGRSAKVGDTSICLLLKLPSATSEGAALYGRCVRPLTDDQVKELAALSNVADLAQAHLSSTAPDEI